MPPSATSSVPTMNADSARGKIQHSARDLLGRTEALERNLGLDARRDFRELLRRETQALNRDVVTGPGLTTLTRMPLLNSSEERVFASEINAALLAAYTLVLGMPMWALIEPLSTMAAPGFRSGSSALIKKYGPFTLVLKVHIPHLFLDRFERSELGNACIDKHGVEHHALLLEQCCELDPIGDTPGIVSHSDDILAELCCRLVQGRLIASRQ